MTDDVRLERLVRDILLAEAPAAAPVDLVPDILAGARRARRRPRWLAFATERPMRLDAAVVVGAPSVRLAATVVFALLFALVAISTLVAGGVIPRPGEPPAYEGGSDWITYSTSQAGHDIYLATEDGTSRRVVGAEGDGVDQGCQRFGRDGRALGYVESVFPSDTAQAWSAVVADVDPNGRLGRERVRLSLPGPIPTCPRWSPDLTRIAWVIAPDDGGDVDVSGIDGTRVTLIHGPLQPNLPASDDHALALGAWSPDGTSLAVVAASGPELATAALWIVPVDGSPSRELVTGEQGRSIDAVSWSPDGSRLGFHTTAMSSGTEAMFIVDAQTGATRFQDTVGNPSAPAWSPDGTRLAYVSDGHVVVSGSDGSDRRVLPPLVVDVGAFARDVTWAPDGSRLLVTAGDAPFVDRGVRFSLLSVDPTGFGPPRIVAPWKLGFYTDLDWQEVPG
jgi:Tol biopolymer transport system component